MSQIQVQGFSPTPKQFEFIQEILKPEVKFIILTTGRQFGKTMMAQNLILKWALETNDSVSMWVSPIYSQCRKVFEDLEKILYDSNLTTSLNKSNLEIEFINGSKIIFRSAERPDNMRGYTLDYLVVDEAAFVRDDTYNMVLKHTTIVKGKKVLFISTPKGKN
jgi:tRNA(Met) C34 N-acetyltransferase TmcA